MKVIKIPSPEEITQLLFLRVQDQLWSIELGNLREMPPSPSLAAGGVWCPPPAGSCGFELSAGRGQERGTQLRPKPELPERRTPTSPLLCQQLIGGGTHGGAPSVGERH